MSDNNNNNTPHLRFPGVTGEWVEYKMSDIFTRLTEKNVEDNKNVLTISAQYGLISQLDFFKKSVSASDVTGYYLLRKGDFAYNKSSSKEKPVGVIKPLKLYNKGVVSTLYICFRCKDPNAVNFWEQYFDSGIFDNEIITIAQEGARNHGLLNVPTNDFFTLKLLLPSQYEQKKIADCLTEMDNLISWQSQKVDALKEKKKGLMQQLFPLPGETTPRLRFSGFFGKWEVKMLREVSQSILVGYPFKGQDITDDSSGHPILRAFCIGEGIIKHGKGYDKYYPYDAEALNKYIVKKGDIVISMDGSVGRNIALVSSNEDDYLLIQRVARIRIKDYPNQLLYQQIISQRFKDYATGEKVGAVIAHISQKQIEVYPIYIPPSPSEQHKVADFLSELDRIIANESLKLDSLKDLKKGLMQKLFPQPTK